MNLRVGALIAGNLLSFLRCFLLCITDYGRPLRPGSFYSPPILMFDYVLIFSSSHTNPAKWLQSNLSFEFITRAKAGLRTTSGVEFLGPGIVLFFS